MFNFYVRFNLISNRRMGWVNLILCGILCSFLVGPGFCADDNEPQLNSTDLTELSLEQLMNIEVVGASKIPQKLSETPASVTVITRDDIQRFGYRTIDEAISRIPGVLVSNDRVYTFVGIRGISRPGDYNTRILFLVNGHRVNELQFSYAKTDEVFPVDIESIERIEFVKGPGSALWGPNAELAVINVVTKEGYSTDGIRASIEYGTFSRKKALVEYGNLSRNGLDVFASISSVVSDGEHRVFIEDWANEPGKNGGIAEDSNGMDAYHILLTAKYGDAQFLYARSERRKADIYGDPGFFSSPFVGHFSDRRTLAELSYEKTLSEKRNEKLMAKVFIDENVFEDFYFEPEPPQDQSYSRKLSGFDYDWPEAPRYWRDGSRSMGLEVRYSMDVSPTMSLVSGLEYNKIYKLLTLVPLPVDVRYNIKSYYVQTDVDLGDTMRFIGGIRNDNYSNLKSVSSPRLGFVWDVSPTSTLKLLYGEAFRPPTTWENYWAVHGLELPPLEPETMRAYELVWEKELGGHSRLVTSLFVNSTSELIDPDLYRNVGNIESKGIETQLETRRPNGRQSYFSLSILKGKNRTTGDWLDNSPRFLATAGTSVPVMSGNFILSAEAKAVGRRRTVNLGGIEGSVPSYTIANLILSTPRSSSEWNASLSIYNLFNKRYFHPVSTDVPPLTITRVPQEGRTVRLQVNYDF